MKVKYLECVSGNDHIIAGETKNISDLEALRLIDAGIAEAISQKSLTALLNRAKKMEAEEEEKQAKILAVQHGEKLKAEAFTLLDESLAVLKTVIALEPEFKDAFVEQMHQKLTSLEEPIDLDEIDTVEDEGNENNPEDGNKDQ